MKKRTIYVPKNPSDLFPTNRSAPPQGFFWADLSRSTPPPMFKRVCHESFIRRQRKPRPGSGLCSVACEDRVGAPAPSILGDVDVARFGQENHTDHEAAGSDHDRVPEPGAGVARRTP